MRHRPWCQGAHRWTGGEAWIQMVTLDRGDFYHKMCFRNSEEEHGIVQGRKHREYNNANWIALNSQHWGVKTSRKEEVIWSVSQEFASSEMKGDAKVEGTWMVKDQQAKGRGYGWISSSCLIGNLRVMGGHQWQELEWEACLPTGD